MKYCPLKGNLRSNKTNNFYEMYLQVFALIVFL